MNSAQKFLYLLSNKQKNKLGVLVLLLLVGMLFEMAGLGVLLPALGIMIKSDITVSYPVLIPLIKALGNPNRVQLVLIVMMFLTLIYLIKTVLLIFIGWQQSKFTGELSADLSEKLFFGYLNQPYTFHLQRNSALLLRNIQTEVAQFTAVAQACMTLASEISILFGISILLLYSEPIGAISVTFFLATTAFVFHRLTRKRLLKWGQDRQYHAGYASQHLIQGLSGVKDLNLLGRGSFFLEQYANHNREYARIQIKTMTLSLAPRYYLELFAVFGLAGLIVIIVIQNRPIEALVPILGIFVAAAFRMLPSLNRIMSSIQIVKFTQSTLEVLYNEFVGINQNRVKAEIGKSQKSNFNSDLFCSKISFSYLNSSNKAIEDISFKILRGQSVGLIGPSGSGKSTLVDIILGLLKPDSGDIKVDGQNLTDCLRDWQNKIGYVPQSIYLIDDSLRKNIAFGIKEEDIDDDAVIRAIKAAQLEEFVQDLPNKLETFVGERGVRLSGGQRQRIGIARALYHDPEVLVLDEATSALDMETEKEVMKSVNMLHGKKTLIIVAHRLTTVEDCDYLYKLEKGKIVSEGTPTQILRIKTA
jgi:ABC-type multidrug transport system fused ATPase/permease subunit